MIIIDILVEKNKAARIKAGHNLKGNVTTYFSIVMLLINITIRISTKGKKNTLQFVWDTLHAIHQANKWS